MSRAAPPESQPAKPVLRTRLLRPFDGGWRTALREFVVIVAGVLAALGAQEWWESREEREREQEYLKQLLADTRDNERRLQEAITEDSITRLKIQQVVGSLHAPGPLPPSDSLVQWIARAGTASDFQAITGTQTALLATGDLRLVRRDTLRARLVAYPAAMESEVRRLHQLREVTISMAGPMVRALPFIRGVFTGEMSADGTDFERLRSDPDVWAVLFILQAANANRLAGLERARRETQRVRRALEAEPATR